MDWIHLHTDNSPKTRGKRAVDDLTLSQSWTADGSSLSSDLGKTSVVGSREGRNLALLGLGLVTFVSIYSTRPPVLVIGSIGMEITHQLERGARPSILKLGRNLTETFLVAREQLAFLAKKYSLPSFTPGALLYYLKAADTPTFQA